VNFIIVIVVGGVLWLALGPFVTDYFKARRLGKVGVMTSAKVLTVSQTYQYVNNDPVIAFSLEVYPQQGPTYEAKTRCLVPLISLSSLPKPGDRIPVIYDPGNLKSVMVDLNAIARTQGADNTPWWQGVTPEWVVSHKTSFLESMTATGDAEKQREYFLAHGKKVLCEFVSITPGPTAEVRYQLRLRWRDPQTQGNHELTIPVNFDIQNPQTSVQKSSAPVIQKLLSPDPNKKYLIPIYIDPQNPELFVVKLNEYEEHSK